MRQISSGLDHEIGVPQKDFPPPSATVVEPKSDPKIYCDCPKSPILGPFQDKCACH